MNHLKALLSVLLGFAQKSLKASASPEKGDRRKVLLCFPFKQLIASVSGSVL